LPDRQWQGSDAKDITPKHQTYGTALLSVFGWFSLVGYAYQQVTDDFGQHPVLGGMQSRVLGVGPQIGYIFPIGNMQGYLNLKGYGEFDAANRPSGWNTWLTFSISPAAPSRDVPPRLIWIKPGCSLRSS